MDDKYTFISIRVTEKFKSQLEAIAKDEMLSLSAFCRSQLAKLVKNLAKSGDGK